MAVPGTTKPFDSSQIPGEIIDMMVVNTENKAEARMVKAEQSIVDKWVVTEGLAAGDRVIVEGLQKVRAGASVDAEPLKAASATPVAR